MNTPAVCQQKVQCLHILSSHQTGNTASGQWKDILMLTAFRSSKQKSISLFLHMMDDLSIQAMFMNSYKGSPLVTTFLLFPWWRPKEITKIDD